MSFFHLHYYPEEQCFVLGEYNDSGLMNTIDIIFE